MGAFVVATGLVAVGFALFPLLDRPMSAWLRRRRVHARQRAEMWYD